MYRQIFAANTSASVDRRSSLRWKQFALISVALPTLEEQRRVAGVLDAANAEAANLQGQLEALKTQKRGLMGKLLSGEVRVGDGETGNLEGAVNSHTECES